MLLHPSKLSLTYIASTYQTQKSIVSECLTYEGIRHDFQELLVACTSFHELRMRMEPSPMILGILFARLLDHSGKVMEDPNSKTSKQS